MTILAELRKLETAADWRTILFRYGFALTAFETLTGLYLFCVTDLSAADMTLLLLHLALGFLFVVPCAMFLLRHLEYRRLFKDRAYDATGALTLAGMVFTLVSGAVLTFTGISGHAVLWWSHIVVSFLCAAGLAAYVRTTLARFRLGLNAKSRDFLRRTVARISLQISAATLLLFVAGWGASLLHKEPDPRKEVPGYSYALGSKNPFSPSLFKTSTGGFLKEERFLGSKSCGTAGCHVDSLKQWEDSVHFRSPNKISTIVENLLIEETKKGHQARGYLQIDELREKVDGRESFRFCAACHAPVALLSGNVNPGRPSETFETFEGASCIACHAVTEGGTNGTEYTIAPPPRYLFAFSKSEAGQFVHRTLIKNKPGFHKKNFMKPFYKESRYCAACHNRLHYMYWEDSPYNDRKNPKNTKHCQTCHMPQVASHDDNSSRTKGTVSDHRTLAANMTVPAMYGLKWQYHLTERFLKDKKMKVQVVAPAKAAPGGELEFVVRLANVGVGHIFPAGPEADLIEAWADVTARTDDGKTIFRYGALDAKGHLDDKKTYVYRIYPVGADGKPLELDRHRTWMFAEDKLQVIPAMQYDELAFRFTLPPGGPTLGPGGPTLGPGGLTLGPGTRRVTIEATLRLRKHNQSFVDWLVGEGELKVPIVDMAKDSAIVEVARDPALSRAARKDWLARLEKPEGLEGLTKKLRFDDASTRRKMTLADAVVLGEAAQAFRNARYGEALAAMASLSPAAKRLPHILHLRKGLEQSAKERTD